METVLIFFASVILAIYAALGEWLADTLLSPFHVRKESIDRVWPFIDLIIVTFGCLLLIRLYKRFRIGCYPSTFLYCFIMPEASNPSGRSQVVGYCHIKPRMATGDITAEGASFFWADGFLGERTGFTSTLVRATREGDDTICHIQFDINDEDRAKRLYSHGILQFQLVTPFGIKKDKDAYAGYLRSYKKEIELQDVGVHAKGYAEWLCKGCSPDKYLRLILAEDGEILLGKLKTVLAATPPPQLWDAHDHMRCGKANIWSHSIPTPQSVILDETLRPFIVRYLRDVLTLLGLDHLAITRFQALAVQAARKEQDDTLVAYERELKVGLIGQGVREDKALTQRAEIIYGEIRDFLLGDSLLDIGCGNGLISSLARQHFNRVQLLDVVEYVPKALNLPFAPYTEGHSLPITESFDTVFLLTVLHHSTNPLELLKLAWEATRQRLIIIESVVGIHHSKPSVKYELLELSDEKQIAYAAFIDWFYNRVLHDDVPVPYNFTTVENWQATFLQHNMRLVQTRHLGQDIEIGPEYHVLFVLDKERPSAG